MRNDSEFYLKCPEFEEICQMSLVPVGNTNIVMRKRNYAHPIDSGIIKVLDMSGLKNIFASAVDTLTDLNYSQIIAAGIPVNSNSFPEIDEMVNHCVSVLEIIGPLVYKTTSFALSAWSRRSEIPEEMKETDDSTVKFMSTLCQSAFYSDKIMLGSITKQIQKETRNMLLLSIPLFFVNPLVSVGNLFIANAYGKNKINNQLNDAKQDMIKQIEVYCNHNVEKNL